MNPNQGQVAVILHGLQERAKELNCLYRVDELLGQKDRPLHEVLRAVAEVLPDGWQYPPVCRARILLENDAFEPAGFQPSAWVQSAPILVDRNPVGAVEVVYREPRPAADEGPFLKEERKLIEAVAERIAARVAQARLQSAISSWSDAAGAATGEWRVVLDFLRNTDPVLLQRTSRRLINYLSWSGIPEARDLLQRSLASISDTAATDENRPRRQALAVKFIDLTSVAFRIAARHLPESEILACLARWIKEEKSSFLVRALENQDTALDEIAEALERFRHAGIEESELALPTQQGLRVSLIRRFFSANPEYINAAKRYLAVEDFYELLGRTVFPRRCHGKLGGKSAGLFLARKIIDKSPQAGQLLRGIKVPRTWYLTSDWLLNFIHHNDLEEILNRKYMDIDQVRQEYPHVVALFKRCSFPTELTKGLALALDDLGDRPLIVRSSSLLEDRSGSAFCGKYKSLFLGNQGSRRERLAALMDAVAEVYASIFGPDPMEYRRERGLLDMHEEMGIMLQEVVGRCVGGYFLPACSGVAFSNNEFRWSARISRSDGLIRLVPGLGTRAVDRVSDYPVLIAPGQPQLRANVTVDEVLKYSPNRVDVINLEKNAFETIDVPEFLRAARGQELPLALLLSRVQQDRLVRPMGRDFRGDDLVFTFEGLVRETPFVAQLRELLDLLQQSLGTPVDVEFAWDAGEIYLLQCRPQGYGKDALPAAIPRDVAEPNNIFSARRHVCNGRVPEATHIVYVDAEMYAGLPDEKLLRDVGRAVGKLNQLLPKRKFVLIGPGRWGSRGDVRLGVPVTYSDINNAAMLVEVARACGNYLPDPSFGTHFFQDLVEASIRYLPVFPGQPGGKLNEAFLRNAENVPRGSAGVCRARRRPAGHRRRPSNRRAGAARGDERGTGRSHGLPGAAGCGRRYPRRRNRGQARIGGTALALAPAHGRAHRCRPRRRKVRRQGALPDRQLQDRERRARQRHRPGRPLRGHGTATSRAPAVDGGMEPLPGRSEFPAHRLPPGRPARPPLHQRQRHCPPHYFRGQNQCPHRSCPSVAAAHCHRFRPRSAREESLKARPAQVAAAG
jgi:pyruvate,water dikinase